MPNMHPYDNKPLRILGPSVSELPADFSGRCRAIKPDPYGFGTHMVRCSNPATKNRDRAAVCGVCARRKVTSVVSIAP